MTANLLLIVAIGLLFAFTFKCDALLKLGGGVTDIRGSMAGNTYSRNAAGNYMRARTKPINPNSPDQHARRVAVASITKRWSNVLTEQQRADWRAYADGTTWTNRLGEAISINGMAAYLRLNVFHLMIPSVYIDDAPTAMGHGGGVTFTFAAESDTTKIQVAEPGGSFDKDTDLHNLWFFCGFPTEPGRIATPRGFKYIGRIWGSALTPLSFPYELDAPYTMRAGQFITVKCMFHDEHYRVSGPHWAHDTAGPA